MNHQNKPRLPCSLLIVAHCWKTRQASSIAGGNTFPTSSPWGGGYNGAHYFPYNFALSLRIVIINVVVLCEYLSQVFPLWGTIKGYCIVLYCLILACSSPVCWPVLYITLNEECTFATHWMALFFTYANWTPKLRRSTDWTPMHCLLKSVPLWNTRSLTSRLSAWHLMLPSTRKPRVVSVKLASPSVACAPELRISYFLKSTMHKGYNMR